MFSPAPSFPQANSEKSKKTIRSTLVSRNVTIAGHRTSVRLEPDMWSGLMEACRRERSSLHDFCTRVAQGKSADTSLTAAIRVQVMNYYRVASTEDGHFKAGHGSGMRMAVPHSVSTTMGMSSQSVASQAMASNQIGQAVAPTQRQAPSSGPFMIGMSRMNNNGSMR